MRAVLTWGASLAIGAAVFWLIAAAVLWWFLPARPTWVVAGVSSDGRSLTVGWGQSFTPCANEPKVRVAAQSDGAVEIDVIQRRSLWTISCASNAGGGFAPTEVRLAAPLGGRSVIGTGQAALPVAPSNRSMGVMPALVGMDGATAQRALSHAGFRSLPRVPERGAVRSQRPAAGTRLQLRDATSVHYDEGTYVSGPTVRLEFTD